MPGTAAGYGLDPTDPQASFDAAYKLSQGGTVFSAWSAYTQGTFQKFVSQVQGALSSATTAASGPGGSVPGNPVSGAITGAVGAVRGSLAGTGQALQSGGQLLIGLLVMGAGGVLLGYLLLTRTAAGRGMVRGGRDLALAVVK
jgi:hypothetical protein